MVLELLVLVAMVVAVRVLMQAVEMVLLAQLTQAVEAVAVEVGVHPMVVAALEALA
jgi:hypothetical protein